MAQQPVGEFFYNKIELFKSETIGSGAYGAVCKARCDKLLCAAKLLYNTLLEVDQGSTSGPRGLSYSDGSRSRRTPVNRFKQECQFLSRVNHPNIVQYLGTYSDPDSHAVVLLMELMHESLTHYIDNAPDTIPLYIQTDIAQDVVLALNYLHNNNIIHRDLSSNNVLLTSNLRAKVSDFGMSTIMDNTGISNSLTLCPGNVSYMPPEALDEPPLYTKSLDIFSFGVLLIQINSRLFPSPTNRFTTMDVIDPISHSSVEAKLAVPEVKRRITHIQTLGGENPLLPIVMDCLRDSGIERPTANQLCDRCESVKASAGYIHSREMAKTPSTEAQAKASDSSENYYEMDPPSCREHVQRISELKEANEQLQERVEELEEELRSNNQISAIRASKLQRVTKMLKDLEKGSAKSTNIALEEEIDSLKTSSVEMESEVKRLNQVMEDLTQANDRYREQIQLQDDTIADLQSIVNDREDYISSTKAHLMAEMEDNQKLRVQLDRQALSRDDSMELEHLDMWINRDRPTKVHEIESELRKKDREVKDLKKFIYIKDAHITSLQQQLHLLESKLGMSKQNKSKQPAAPKPIAKPRSQKVQVEWTSGTKAPCVVQAGSTAVNGTNVYCRPANSGEIYEFSPKKMTWRQLEKCPSNAYALVTIDGTLTAVGGMSTRRLLSFVESNPKDPWQELYPPMSVERFNAAATYSNDILIVAGGFGTGWISIPDVEILDVTTHTWSTTHSLPYSIYSASAAVCNNNVYIVGGYYKKARGHFSVLSCPLSVITGKEEPQLDTEGSTPWHKITDVPVCRSTCITFRGKLAVLGGRQVNGFQTPTLYVYNANSNTWTPVSDMLLARSECHAAVVNDRKIVVAGGYTDGGLTNDVEIGDIIYN